MLKTFHQNVLTGTTTHFGTPNPPVIDKGRCIGDIWWIEPELGGTQ